MTTFIGLDIGTTTIKALAATNLGVAAEASAYTPWTREHNKQILKPAILWKTCQDVISQSLDGLDSKVNSVRALAVTSMGEAGLYVVGTTARTNIGSWQDLSRNEIAYQDFLTQWDPQEVFQRTGIAPGPKFGLFRMREDNLHLPEARWLSVADYVVWCLTGGSVVATHPSLASRTMAYNWQSGDWDAEMLEWAGLAPVNMPTIKSASQGLGVVTNCCDERIIGATVVNAGHDHVAAAYGADLQPGEMVDSTGTAESLLIRSAIPTVSQQARALGLMWGRSLFADGSFVALVPTPAGGAAESWARGMLGLRWDDVHAAARQTSVCFDAEGWHNHRAQWQGLGYDATPLDLYSAVLVGVAESVRDRLERAEMLMRRPYTSLKVVGGVVKHDAWLAIRAEILRRQQLLLKTTGGALFGAIRAAAAAVDAESPLVPIWEPYVLHDAKDGCNGAARRDPPIGSRCRDSTRAGETNGDR